MSEKIESKQSIWNENFDRVVQSNNHFLSTSTSTKKVIRVN